MPFKFFTIPIDECTQAEAELNAFVQRHRIRSIEKRWIERDSEAFWHFCVTYAQEAESLPQRIPAAPPLTERKTTTTRPKVDYREVLSPEDFAIYDQLRKRREAIAAEAKVPIYLVFNNQQLAQMVQQRIASKSALEKLSGVSDGRVGKYGEKILEVLQQAWSGHEAERKSA